MIKRKVAPFYAAGGDKILRLEYDLNPDSLVLDVGGYEGQWASDIFGRYACHIHIFEPVPIYAEEIKKRFRMNSKIIVHELGMYSTTTRKKISVNESASSI